MTAERQTDNPETGERRYAIGELAELGGVSRRTVRYYVQRGLLEAPTGVGRGRHYTRRHLDTLIRIRELQEAGRPLAEIAGLLGGAGHRESRPSEPGNVTPLHPVPGPAPAARYSRWTRVEIADGIELHLRDLRLDSRQARAIGEAITRILHSGGRPWTT